MRRRTTSTADPWMGYRERSNHGEHSRRLSWIREGHDRDRPLRRIRAGNECHLSMGESLVMKNDIRPLSYRRERRRLRRIGCHTGHRVPPCLELQAATIQCECAESDAHPDASASDTAAIRADGSNLQCESTIGSRAGQSKHTKCNSPDPHRVDDDGSWEPLGYPYEHRCSVYHQSATLYAAVLMRQSATLYAAVLMRQSTTLHAAVLTRQSATNFAVVFTTKMLRTTLRCLPPKRYELCCSVYHQSATNYVAVSTHQCSTDTLRCLLDF